jgi:hypothetical protein
MTEKTNLEKAKYAIEKTIELAAGSDLEHSYHESATAYALIAIAETLAEINQKLANKSDTKTEGV